MFEAVGYISHQTEQGVVTLTVPLERGYRIDQQEIYTARVIFSDGRTIRPEQRAAIHATIKDISEWSGYGKGKEEIEMLKAWFKLELIILTGCEWFSFADCDVTTAREYLQLLIDFCIKHGVPCKESLLKRTEDVGKYLYACMVHKKCVVCGVGGEYSSVDLHHIDAIGGAYRATTEHIGRDGLTLCRIHHGECHTLGKATFEQRYNIFGIKIDNTIARIHNLI